FGQEGLAGGREPGAARETMEQRHAHFPLEVADLLGERRLRDAQPTCRPEEAPYLGDRDEVPQVPEFHSGQSLQGGFDEPPDEAASLAGLRHLKRTRLIPQARVRTI